jgi:hypothetical protein
VLKLRKPFGLDPFVDCVLVAGRCCAVRDALKDIEPQTELLLRDGDADTSAVAVPDDGVTTNFAVRDPLRDARF